MKDPVPLVSRSSLLSAVCCAGRALCASLLVLVAVVATVRPPTRTLAAAMQAPRPGSSNPAEEEEERDHASQASDVLRALHRSRAPQPPPTRIVVTLVLPRALPEPAPTLRLALPSPLDSSVRRQL